MNIEKENVLKGLLNGIGERELKSLDGDICFGDNGYYQENYVKNYFKDPIFVLDAFNKIYQVDPEKAEFYNSINNKILLRSRGGYTQFNSNKDEHEIDDSAGGDIIIHKYMFDKDGILIIPECSLMISFNEAELKYRLNNNPEVVSLESKSDFVDKLLLKAFNQTEKPFEILILDFENILPDELYTIINDEIVTVPVIKNIPNKSEIRILIRKNNTITKKYEFELTDLESGDGFKTENGIFYIAHSLDKINEIYKEKYPNSQIGERLVYEDKLSEANKAHAEVLEGLLTTNEKLISDKKEQDIQLVQNNLEIKKLRAKLEAMVNCAQGRIWYEKKFGDSFLEAKSFVLKNNEMDHDQEKIINEVDLMNKRNVASEIRNRHDINTAEQREAAAGSKREGEAVIMNQKIKHEQVKVASTVIKSISGILKGF